MGTATIHTAVTTTIKTTIAATNPTTANTTAAIAARVAARTATNPTTPPSDCSAASAALLAVCPPTRHHRKCLWLLCGDAMVRTRTQTASSGQAACGLVQDCNAKPKG